MIRKLWNRVFKTNGPGFWESVGDSFRTGKFKYFFHNLSCQLRRGRYNTCYGYENTLYDRVLFSLGVFVMDPLGIRYRSLCKIKLSFGHYDEMSDGQWLRHPMPWVRSRAKRVIKMLQGRN